jgi:HSP20 family molecular chaperone IbpA
MSKRDPKSWMWPEAIELIERAERLHRQFFRIARSATSEPTWEPPLDMFETGRDVWIVVALPGVTPERVRVVVANGTLIVEGLRALPSELRDATIHRMEIPYGRFERRIELPAGGYQLASQTLADGCLFINLRRLA